MESLAYNIMRTTLRELKDLNIEEIENKITSLKCERKTATTAIHWLESIKKQKENGFIK